MAGRLLKVAYGLRIHHFAGWTLDRWLIFLPLLAALLAVLIRRFTLSPAGWLVVALLALCRRRIWAWRRWGRHRTYVVFEPRPELGDAGCRVHGPGR